MARNRRNKRSSRSVLEVMTSKTFINLTIALLLIIAVCFATITYCNNQEKELLAKQREELEKSIEKIFEETNQNIINSNNTARNSIIRISAVGDILCENNMLENAKDGDTYNFESIFKNVSNFFFLIIFGSLNFSNIFNPTIKLHSSNN